MKKEIIVFDLETNGFQKSSVLSVSALKVEFDTVTNSFLEKERYNRFYYRNPWESFNPSAIKVNGLTDEVIEKERDGAAYPKYFKDDEKSLREFFKGVDHFVAHNIEFDTSFLSFGLRCKFCTMRANTGIVWQSNKWPKLSEAASFYNVEYDPEKLHYGMYDVEITFGVFEKMFDSSITRGMVEKFIFS